MYGTSICINIITCEQDKATNAAFDCLNLSLFWTWKLFVGLKNKPCSLQNGCYIYEGYVGPTLGIEK